VEPALGLLHAAPDPFAAALAACDAPLHSWARTAARGGGRWRDAGPGAVGGGPGPSNGSPECPSVGSIDHKLGTCTPCDFIHRGFCYNVETCEYCHLCVAHNVRRRKRDKKRCLRAADELELSASLLAGALRWPAQELHC